MDTAHIKTVQQQPICSLGGFPPGSNQQKMKVALASSQRMCGKVMFKPILGADHEQDASLILDRLCNLPWTVSDHPASLVGR